MRVVVTPAVLASALSLRVALCRSLRRPVREPKGAGGAVRDSAVHGAPDRWWQGDQDDLVAFAVHPKDPVTMDFPEVLDAGGGFEDPEPEQAEQCDKGEVVDVGGVPAGGQHGLELQVAQAESWGLRWHVGASNILSWGVLQHAVDDAGAVEPDQHREAAGDGGGLIAANLLHPAQVDLQVGSLRQQR